MNNFEMLNEPSWKEKLILKFSGTIAFIVFICIVLLAFYGVCQLYTRDARLNLRESQRARIAQLETKVCFLENNDWAMIFQQLPPVVQGELKAMNEKIKQKKERK